MDRLNRFVAQIYGYAVCLITVIVMLISIKGIIDAAFDLSDPVRAHGGAFGRWPAADEFRIVQDGGAPGGRQAATVGARWQRRGGGYRFI